MVHRLNHQCTAVVGTIWTWKVFFGRFFLRLSRIKRSQVMWMVKFSPTALNFGYDFLLLVHFFGHLVEYDHEANNYRSCELVKLAYLIIFK